MHGKGKVQQSRLQQWKEACAITFRLAANAQGQYESTHAHSVDDSISICPSLGKVDTVVATWKVFACLPV